MKAASGLDVPMDSRVNQSVKLILSDRLSMGSHKITMATKSTNPNLWKKDVRLKSNKFLFRENLLFDFMSNTAQGFYETSYLMGNGINAATS